MPTFAFALNLLGMYIIVYLQKAIKLSIKLFVKDKKYC